MGYKYGFFHVINRLHSSFRFVWGITSQGKMPLSVGPVRPVPRALNKHYSARGGPINISFVYITQGCYVNILGKFRDLRAVRWLFT